MLKLFPIRQQLSHRRHPLHPSSIRDVRSLLRIQTVILLHILYFPLNLVGKDERIHNLRRASVDTGKGLIGPPYLNKD